MVRYGISSCRQLRGSVARAALIVMAVFILVAGIWITDLISRVAEPIIIRRFKIEPNQASLIRRWLRAVMVVCLVLFSLVSVKIPLTVFAFAGGALAIGLGFGTQTMLKNFVSGILILFERPFRVGDVLDVGGQKGSVTSIGLRASVLQLWDGTETLIPNSFLLENNVTNWTYSNRKVRFAVTVGVAYGSDPRRVIQLLGEVADRHGVVEKEPKPQVLFTEFGDSTLTFELRYWVDVAKANAAQVSSDLRLMVASPFAEHGIVIDFPQRDIHLHASRPIQVQVVSPGNAQGSGLRLITVLRPFLQAVQLLLTLAAIGLFVAGCATPNVNPPQARANTGYVDFHADASAGLSWEVARWEDHKREFQRVFWELEPPPGGVLRLAFAPGRHRLRVALLNRVITKPVEIEVEVQDGKILPIRVALTEAGTTVVKTKEQSRGGTAYGRYGRRTKIGSDETVMYDISATAAPPVAYQPKEQMPYAR